MRQTAGHPIVRLSEEIIARDQLTTLTVTHSMHQVANLGDRVIMMYQGRIIHDLCGAEKRRLRVDDLLASKKYAAASRRPSCCGVRVCEPSSRGQS